MSMYADEKSDEGIRPMKQPNKEGSPSAEAVEGRTSPEGNGGETAAARTLRRDTASIGLAGVRRAARQSKSVRFTALLHHITVDLLEQSYCALERDSAPGIDGVTWQAYGENLEEKLSDLHDRIHKGSYRARPARRTYIPKADGSRRPLAILCVEDKIVQQAVATVLEAIYEEDFIKLELRAITNSSLNRDSAMVISSTSGKNHKVKPSNSGALVWGANVRTWHP
jgi:RNA-directed DNA polymerase